MEHHKLLVVSLLQHVFQHGEQRHVEHIAVLGKRLLDKAAVVSFFAKDVDKRVVGTLVGKECGVESCLAESTDDATCPVDAVVVFGSSKRE